MSDLSDSRCKSVKGGGACQTAKSVNMEVKVCLADSNIRKSHFRGVSCNVLKPSILKVQASNGGH